MFRIYTNYWNTSTVLIDRIATNILYNLGIPSLKREQQTKRCSSRIPHLSSDLPPWIGSNFDDKYFENYTSSTIFAQEFLSRTTSSKGRPEAEFRGSQRVGVARVRQWRRAPRGGSEGGSEGCATRTFLQCPQSLFWCLLVRRERHTHTHRLRGTSNATHSLPTRCSNRRHLLPLSARLTLQSSAHCGTGVTRLTLHCTDTFN